MMKISYYKSADDNLAKTYCALAEKCYYNNMKTFVVASNEEYAKNLDQVLWTYSKKHFIPHATTDDPSPEIQPILISTKVSLDNQPQVILAVNNNLNSLESTLNDIFSSKKTSITKFIILEDQAVGLGFEKIKTLLDKHKNLSQNIERFEQNLKGAWEKL